MSLTIMPRAFCGRSTRSRRCSPGRPPWTRHRSSFTGSESSPPIRQHTLPGTRTDAQQMYRALAHGNPTHPRHRTRAIPTHRSPTHSRSALYVTLFVPIYTALGHRTQPEPIQPQQHTTIERDTLRIKPRCLIQYLRYTTDKTARPYTSHLHAKTGRARSAELYDGFHPALGI